MQSDGIQLLAERLQALQADGLKVNPATANPGALLVSGFTMLALMHLKGWGNGAPPCGPRQND